MLRRVAKHRVTTYGGVEPSLIDRDSGSQQSASYSLTSISLLEELGSHREETRLMDYGYELHELANDSNSGNDGDDEDDFDT